MTIRVMQVGLGPIGSRVLRQLAEREGFVPVAVVDIDPQKVGRDAGEFCGLDRPLGISVLGDLGAALEAGTADAVAMCTGSSLERVASDLEAVLASGLPVVSTTEELACPAYTQGDLTRRLDEVARTSGTALVGTGVNPGFAMDTLPIALTAACERVDSIAVDRVQDASYRRIPFQQKIGAGMEPEDFRAKVRRGKLGHVGLTESIAMIAAAMGWTLDRVTDEVEPKISLSKVASDVLTVEAGQVAGIIQDGIGYRENEPVIHLHMEAYLGAPESYDTVRILGSPSLTSTIEGGIDGDVATASVTVNTLPRILTAPPGLHTMRDLPLVSWWSGA